MTTIEVRMAHSLGKTEALRRIRTKAEPMIASGRAPIQSMEWTADGARLTSANSEGTLVCTDTEVVVTARLGSLVHELCRQHYALQRTHQRERQDKGSGQPEHKMKPDRRAEPELGEDGGERHDEPRDQDHENRRPVARIGLGEISAARLA